MDWSPRFTALTIILVVTKISFMTPAHSVPNESGQFPLEVPSARNQDAENQKAQELVDHGKAAYRSRKYEKAVALYSELLKLKPADARIFYNRGLAYYKLQDLDRAFADFTDTINFAPTFYFAWMNRANIYSRKNKFAEAVADYDKAIALKSDDFLIWYNRGIAHGRLGDSQSALRDLNEALRLHPYDGASYSARADLYFTLGNLALARADYKRALTIKPDNKHAEQKLRELEGAVANDAVPGIVIQPNNAGNTTASDLAALAISACFDNGENEGGLRALAKTSGWNPVDEQELKKNSGPAVSMIGGWTFDAAVGALAIMQSRENVTPPVYVCTVTSKLPESIEFKAVRSAIEEALKTSTADTVEHGDQTTVGLWVPHTSTCEARTALVYTRGSQFLTIRILHGRVRSTTSGQEPYPPIDGL